MSGILWIIFVGFVAGMIARWLSPGPNTPAGFVLTVVLGIAGAFLATFVGQTIGWYRADQGAGFIAATSRRAGRAVHLEPAGGERRHRRPRQSEGLGPHLIGAAFNPAPVRTQEATMGLMDILNGMQNGPKGQRQPTPPPGQSGSGGMSPILLALLGLLAYKGMQGGGLGNVLGGGRRPGATATARGGAGDVLGGMFGAASRRKPGGGGLGDILGGMLGGPARQARRHEMRPRRPAAAVSATFSAESSAAAPPARCSMAGSAR